MFIIDQQTDNQLASDYKTELLLRPRFELRFKFSYGFCLLLLFSKYIPD